MAFQTNVLRGGEWVTETVNLQAVLKGKSTPQVPKKQRLLKPPQCGLLTRTVVESHLVQSMLPVRLRGARYNDVAFIGSYDVRICELRRDGQLKEVARKSDFGSRIRNACVIGSFDIKDDDDDKYAFTSSAEGFAPGSQLFSQFSQTGQLPPQLLMLVLECGDCVFLFMRRGSDGRLEFVTSRVESPREHLVYPGYHLAIDPSSRYMALACAQDFFVVYELDGMNNMNQRYMADQPLNPVMSTRPRGVQGVIHKVSFLYPRTGDDHHIILLLIIVRNGRSRMVIYEWELGDDLRHVFAEEKAGHRMPVENQMPVLIIPLTVKSAFIAISPDQVAVCTEGLHGPPNFDAIEMNYPKATRNHHGREAPVWTAWARPFRLSPYFRDRDCIYLAREDGVVIFIEADSDSALDRSTFMDTFDSNISTAFTCLFDQYTDVLLLGSDSGPGAIWKVPARQPLGLLGTLPNWSPSVDFVTTDEFSTWNQEIGASGNKMVPYQSHQLRKSDRVFATSGHAQKGSITEYRYGLKAGIGLDLAYDRDVKEAWLLPSDYSSSAGGFHIILSMANSSALLQLSETFSEAQELTSDDAAFDLSSPTLAVARTVNFIVQITKAFIVLLGPEGSNRYRYEDLLPLTAGVISDACVQDELIAISTHIDTEFYIHTFVLDAKKLAISHAGTIQVDGDITCISLGPAQTVLAGVWKNGRAFLGKGSSRSPVEQGTLSHLDMIEIAQVLRDNDDNVAGADTPFIEAVASIISVWGATILGTRSGEVIKLTDAGVQCEKFGTSTARITCSWHPGKLEPTVLISCDKNLVLLRNQNTGNALFDSVRSKDKLRVWPVDASNLAAPSPSVDYAAAVDVPSGSPDITPILVISGPKILLAEMQHQPGPVHRHLPVGGTPMKVIYSHHLQCLVVAVGKEDQPTLMFVDPDTGEDLGRPADKKKNTPVDFISGLGKKGDRIHALGEWEFKKDGSTWRYILVATRDGRLIVVSTARGEAREDGPPLISYWMQFKKPRFERPVYSVVGYDQGLIYCVGQTIHWDVLDTTEKKLKTVKSFDLGSPATSIRISNGKLMALTSRDSLEIIGMGEAMGQSHVDPKTRNAIHMIEVAGLQPDEPMGSIVLVADRDCGVTGLWVPWQSPGKDCEVVFEAELATSIRRFRRGRTRPLWEQGGHIPKYGRLASTMDDAEILGTSIDGSMQHFTLLNTEIWRLFRFIQNIALTNEEMYPFTHEKVDDYRDFDPEPRLDRGLEMHVDGDMLRRCLEKRSLERLLSWPAHEARFIQLLREVDGMEQARVGGLDEGTHVGGQTVGLGSREHCFAVAYDILDYFLRPVL